MSSGDRSRSRRRTFRGAAIAALCLCGGVTAAAGPALGSAHAARPAATTTTGAPTFPAKLIQAARKEARLDANGKKLHGTVTMIDQNGGFESQIIETALKPFEQVTGVTVNYTGSQNYQQIVQTDVQAGNPPDVVNDAGSGNMRNYASKGLLVPLSSFLDMKTMAKQFNKGILNALTFRKKLYAVEAAVHPQMLYINAKTYSGARPPKSWSALVSYSLQLAKQGKTPWCVALSASAQTGWPAAYFIEELFAKSFGANALTKWGLDQIPWTSPMVKKAFTLYGQLFTTPGVISGGIAQALSTPIAQGPVGLYSTPQRCQFFVWGEYAAGIAESQVPGLKPIVNIQTFPLPAPNTGHAANEQASGWAMYAFHNTPQVRAFIKYWSSSAFQSLLASSGEWVMANNQVKDYPNPLLKRAAKQLADARAVGFGPYFMSDVAVKTAYLQAILNFLQNPSTLDADLANVQQVASTQGVGA